jgi:hypothetical protein
MCPENIATFHPCRGEQNARCHYYKHRPPDGGPNHRLSTSVKRSAYLRYHTLWGLNAEALLRTGRSRLP